MAEESARKPYSIVFEIPGLPKTINAMGRHHWTMKTKEAMLWRNSVLWTVGKRRPSKPLERIKVTYTRFSSCRLDRDNLAISFKHVQDGLVDAGVVIDDTDEHIVEAHWKWEKAPARQGKIRVEVVEVMASQDAPDASDLKHEVEEGPSAGK